MIDLVKLEQYRENNRIEAKKALGGLPQSIWETYSAFANALGGVILLGVIESGDKTLRTVDLPDPEALVREFWDLVNCRSKASVNILRKEDVTIETVNGDHIVMIRVPRAGRTQKPVYVSGDLYRGTYYRSGEGDCRCTAAEVDSMLRDAATESWDLRPLEEQRLSSLDPESVRLFHRQVRALHPDAALEDIQEFLLRAGAAWRGDVLHPTAAGLLMLGTEEAIQRSFPSFSLQYREKGQNRLAPVTENGGNLFRFYSRVCPRLTEELLEPQVRAAVREAMVNCLVNADYRGQGGVMIVKRRNMLTFSNPGVFRIDPATARSGGVSDPRNAALVRLFRLIDAAQGAGSGIPSLFSVWKRQGWKEPSLLEKDGTVTFSLPLQSGAGARRSGRLSPALIAVKKQIIVDYLTEHSAAPTSEIARCAGLSAAKTREYLAELAGAGIVVPECAGRSRVYRLRA